MADQATRQEVSDRLDALRAELRDRGLDGFVLPRADEHLGEFLAANAERLAWLTGFTGSAGTAVILADRAAVFSDGRYTLQLRDQVDTGRWETRHIVDEPPQDWIAERLGAGRLGYDPWLHTLSGVERMQKAVAKAGGALVAVDDNPIDAIWSDRPPAPAAPAMPHGAEYAGRSSAEKRAEVAELLAKEGEAAAVLTSPESIAWLLNIRGADVPSTPIALAFAVMHAAGEVDLYIDAAKVPEATRAHLGNAVTLHPREALESGLAALGAGGAKVRVDPGAAPARVAQLLEAAGATVSKADDPVVLPRARKNETELAGSRAAHRRDGAAMVRFLHWLSVAGPAGAVDELAAAERLRAFRAADGMFRGTSFDTISGAGPNGAIVHYRVTPDTNRVLAPGELYLVDSGGQYLDATTDITRTVAIGRPGTLERDRFTRVLKGHVAIATAVFPKGTSGGQLDAFARAALWRVGLDFDHGTGHGVGSYLGVHEGPQRISKAGQGVALEPGMIVSNEPGYYKAGAFGIRIENLLAVTPAAIDGAEREMLGFETLSFAPIDRVLIDPALLTAEEIGWLDHYHDQVWAKVSPLLAEDERDVRDWLRAATRPIAPHGVPTVYEEDA